MTLNGHFTLNFHYNEQPFEKLFLHIYSRVCLYHVTGGDARKWTVMRKIFGIRGHLRIFRMDATSSEVPTRNLNI